VSNLSFKVHDE
jgi:RNA recognition motif-containing protein